MHTQARPAASAKEPPHGGPADDLSLLRRMGAGDEDAFGSFFLRWRDPFRRIAAGILRDQDAANDAVSEALIQVHAVVSSGSFPADPEDATRWIRGVARGCAFRQRGDSLTVHGEWIERLPAKDDALDEEPRSGENSARYAAVMRALQKLPPRTGNALRMRFMEGLSYAEIADRQGGTVSGARNRVARGRLHLVAITHSRRPGRRKTEDLDRLPPEDRALVLNTAAIVRTRTPGVGAFAISEEVCRRTSILISPESVSKSPLTDIHHGRIR